MAIISWRRRLAFRAALFIVVAALVELLSYGLVQVSGDRITYANDRAAAFTIDDADTFIRLRQLYHPQLGWKPRFDTEYGERPRPVRYGPAMIATFGDSFTYGAGVRDTQTWQSQASQRLGADVLNFGVSGYGTGQALLRFREDFGSVRTPVVVMGFIPTNLPRALGLYRKFLHRRTGLPLTKPWFGEHDGVLVVHPNPIGTIDGLDALRDPEFVRTIGADDPWFNAGGLPTRGFPHTRLLFDHGFWRQYFHGFVAQDTTGVNSRPWQDSWQHPDQARVMMAILTTFAREAEAMGATPIILLQGPPAEIKAIVNEGAPTSTLVAVRGYLDEAGLSYFDSIEMIAEHTHDMDQLRRLYQPSAHLSAAGNRLLAREFVDFLDDRGLLQPSAPAGTDASRRPR